MEFVDNVSQEEYTDFVINHKYSHFLKSYEWGEVSKCRGLSPYYVGLKNDGKLVATALLLKKQLPLGYSYFYIPRGYTIDYSDTSLLNEFTNYIKNFTNKHKSLFFKIDPDIKLHTIDKDAKVIDDGINNYKLVNDLVDIGFKRKKLNYYFENMQPRYTFRVDVSSDMDVVRKRYSKTVFRFIKQGSKYDVDVRVGTRNDIDEFIRLMKMTEKRQGFFSHNYDFYPQLYDIFSKSNSVSLLLASVSLSHCLEVIHEEIKNCSDQVKLQKLKNTENLFKSVSSVKDSIVISSYINIHYGNKSWYLYGANDLTFKDTFANYKLFDFQIEHAHNLGKEIFDEFGTIGNPMSKKSVAGLHEFKKKFGGEYTEFIGEFTYVTKPFMYFIFDKVIPLYRKPMRFLRHLKVKLQGGK